MAALKRRPGVERAAAPPGDTPIAVGRPHRTLCDVEMLVYDFDELGVRTEVLPAGSFFQPWEPLGHWRGREVPITLGEGAAGFDWGVTSAEGHFLRWDDFFCRCRVNDTDMVEGLQRRY